MKTSLVCIDVYTVSEGDTLYSIAEKYDLPVSLLMKVNCIDNPYNLQIGTKKHGIKLDSLMRANPNIDTYNMLIGTELCIPRGR